MIKLFKAKSESNLDSFFRLCLLFLNAEWSTLIFTFLLFEASYVIISIALKLSITSLILTVKICLDN